MAAATTSAVIAPGYLGNLSAPQQDALQQMLKLFPLPASATSQSLIDDYHSDLLRFLRARQFNVQNAATMMKECVDFRIKMNVDTILTDPTIAVGPIDEQFHRVIAHSFHKYDKKGRPVYFEKTGAINLQELVGTFSTDQLTRRHVWFMEHMCDRMKRSPRGIWTGGDSRVEQMIHIADLKGLTLNLLQHIPVMNLFRETTRIDQAYYPERMGKMVMIRAPSIFPTIWKLIAPLLDPVTKEKILILGDDFQSTLLELIDAENLPVEYGGKCACAGGCIHVHLDREVFVPAGSTHLEPVLLGPIGSTVTWAFQSVGHDISFAAIHRLPSGQDKVISPLARQENAATVTITGATTTTEAGTLFLQFDNSYSLFTGKTIKFRYTVSHTDKPQ